VPQLAWSLANVGAVSGAMRSGGAGSRRWCQRFAAHAPSARPMKYRSRSWSSRARLAGIRSSVHAPDNQTWFDLIQ
jgi:hypothetical protein